MSVSQTLPPPSTVSSSGSDVDEQALSTTGRTRNSYSVTCKRFLCGPHQTEHGPGPPDSLVLDKSHLAEKVVRDVSVPSSSSTVPPGAHGPVPRT